LYAHAEDPAALARIHRALDAGGAEPPPEPEGPLWARLDPGAILVGLALLLLLTESLMDAGPTRGTGRTGPTRPSRSGRTS
ncbi:MAG: hypothetical protein ACOC8K_09215, partial [Gemmatimonadota bacterium]